MCLAPKIPDLPAPPPPAPVAPVFKAKKLEQKSGLVASQKKAAKYGASQLRIPLNSVNTPS